jgi:hypothetical protein
VDRCRSAFCAETRHASVAQVGGGDGKAQTHAVAVSHEDEAGTVGLMADRQNGEAASEERVRRIRHLDFVRLRRRRVVEGGINMSARLTIWIGNWS